MRVIKFQKDISREVISRKFPTNISTVFHTETTQKQHSPQVIVMWNTCRVFVELSYIYITFSIYKTSFKQHPFSKEVL